MISTGLLGDALSAPANSASSKKPSPIVTCLCLLAPHRCGVQGLCEVHGQTCVGLSSPETLANVGEYGNTAHFLVRHEALGIGQTDQSCHHEVWLHLDFVDRCAQATNSLERTFSAVPLQQTERSHKRGCQGPFTFFVIRRPLAASLGSALRTTRATCCDLNKTISNRLDETQIFYCDSRVCFVFFIVIDHMLSMHDHLNTRATTKKKEEKFGERKTMCKHDPVDRASKNKSNTK